MALYDPLNGVYRKVTKSYDPVSGTHRKVIKAYDDVEGVYRQYFESNLKASALAVGDSVWIKVNNIDYEFIVVQQGNPDSALYDESCDGTWLLMKDIYINIAWDQTSNNYQDSDGQAYLNSTFIGLLDSDVQAAIKQVKIPYWKGPGDGGSLASASKGLSARVFLLSRNEVAATAVNSVGDEYASKEGRPLAYFQEMDTTRDIGRIAYYVGDASSWLLRTVHTASTSSAFSVDTDGSCIVTYIIDTRIIGIRPAFIIDRDTPIDQSTGKNIIE